jgi:hypothetical protein
VCVCVCVCERVFNFLMLIKNLNGKVIFPNKKTIDNANI